jgi:ribosomal protein L7/L12
MATSADGPGRPDRGAVAPISEKLGLAYGSPAPKIPDEVVQLAQAGDRLSAIKKCRELTGAGSNEAQAVVEGL